MNYKEEEILIESIQNYVEKEKKDRVRKTTYEERSRKVEEKWKREDKKRNDKIILILKIQDVFGIKPALPFEILDTLDDEDLDCLLHDFNKTNNDCDKEIVHKIIDNSF